MIIQLQQKCSSTYQGCLNDPKRIVKYGVLFACSIVMIYQLSECFSKLNYPPITTHSHFDLNETISYPALTICRDPPYKPEAMERYNLSYHTRFTNAWRYLNYAEVDLDEMFREVTYGVDEVVGQYGLEGHGYNIKIVSEIYFNYGQCHTIMPLITTRGSWKTYGYSLVLLHNLMSIEDSLGEKEPGWHIFIHEPKENFTEINMETSGRGEYMYLKVGEDVDIKLTAQHFNQLSSNENSCSNDINYSVIRCSELCNWSKITSSVGCSAPWMPVINQPYCNNFTLMRDLIVQYQALSDVKFDECGCMEPCRTVIYSAFVMSRNPFLNQPVPSSQIWLYYASKMVTVFEERPGYDFSQFVADMGGSLGFLLGLSVLGLIGILEKITAVVFKSCIQKRQATAAEQADRSARSEGREYPKLNVDAPQEIAIKYNKY